MTTSTSTRETVSSMPSQAVLNQSLLKARIDASKLANGVYYTIITTPAMDEFSKPASFQIRSNQPLGDIGSMTTIKVALSGFTRSFGYTDRNTGERKQGVDSTVFMDLIN